MSNRAEAIVDLTAIAANVKKLKATSGTELMAVVKADAYGHGLVPVAKAALNAGASWLGVALVEEAHYPDVVLVGEMRDYETFEAAIRAAETGHLVFGTIHASSAWQTFGRIYDLFPEQEREQIRKLMAYNLRAIIYQKLLPTLHANIGRIPAIEILINTPGVQKYILEGREGELLEIIKNSHHEGMLDFTSSLVGLVEKEYVHQNVALQATPKPEELKMRLKGIR
jgi:twitching motility protein PilT